mmetsp:Transcript_24260/g.58463  ORF Transcript_24260/g.58463 Transcript_24260/m.58463 type:complete len:681 (+) Transcript_24260:178-2220(+)
MRRRQLQRQVLGASNRREAPDAPSELLQSRSMLSFTPKSEGDLLTPRERTPRDGYCLVDEAEKMGKIQRRRDVKAPAQLSASQTALEASRALKQQGKHTVGMNGHTDNVMTIMREHFQKRPLEQLRAAFRKADKDGSGALTLEEFQKVVRSLHLGLTDKDAAAMFRLSDADGSGVLEMDEFFLNFRHDKFPREGFFGRKAMKGAISKEERMELATRLNRVELPPVSSLDEVFEVVQRYVDQVGSAKFVFRMMDGNHSGHIDKSELKAALRPLSFEITDAQVEETMKAINKMVGLPESDPLTYYSFALAFNANVNHKSLIELRDDEQRQKRLQEHASRMPEDSNVKSTDELMRHVATMKAPPLSHSQPQSELTPSASAPALRHTPDDPAISHAKGMTIDKGLRHVYSVTGRHPGALQRTNSGFHLMQTASDVSPLIQPVGGSPMRNGAAMVTPPSSEKGYGMRTPSSSVESSPFITRSTGSTFGHSGSLSALHKSREGSRSVSECLFPDSNSSHFMDEHTRTSSSLKSSMTVGSLQRPVDQEQSKQRKEAQRAHKISMHNYHESRLRDSLDNFEAKQELTSQFKQNKIISNLERMTDIQLLRLSQSFDRGKLVVDVEPPVTEGWGPSRPHLNSHWQTIAGIHVDPPRSEQKMVSNYRRVYPEMQLAASRSKWGGCHASKES